MECNKINGIFYPYLKSIKKHNFRTAGGILGSGIQYVCSDKEKVLGLVSSCIFITIIFISIINYFSILQ